MDEPTMHAESAQQLFASINAMMREQQQFMAQTAELQRQMAATLMQQQQAATSQSQPVDISAHDSREYRAEGIMMPKFSGTKDDDVADYMFSAKLYFESKNIKYGDDTSQQRPLSLLVANLKGPAAAWYREYVSHDGNFLHSVTQFEELLTSEFTAPDRQENLRDQLLRLRQNNFTCLEDYVSAFRNIICKVENMSDIDKVMHFQKGLIMDIKQEVKLRQFRTTTEAISFALMYDRTHRPQGRGGSQPSQRRSYTQQRPRTEEGPTPMEIGSARIVSRDECMRRNLCFYCKEPGHRLVDCRKRQARNNEREASYSHHNRNSFRANQGTFRRIVDEDEDAVEVVDSLQMNMASVNDALSCQTELLRFQGLLNGKPIRVLIDSGAEQNIGRPGLAEHLVDTTKISAERFDGTTTAVRSAKRCLETLTFSGQEFENVSLIEWDVSSNQDVILGIPWLIQFNPVINWQTGVMSFDKKRTMADFRYVNTTVKSEAISPAQKLVNDRLQYDPTMDKQAAWNEVMPIGYCHTPVPSSVGATVGDTVGHRGSGPDLHPVSTSEFVSKVKDDTYVEVYHVNVKTSAKRKIVPPSLQPVLTEYSDVFPTELPAGLPPSRSIEHEVVLKPGAKPSNRAPFRLSKVEQEALDIFVADLLKKNWIEVSDSPWVSNIFGVPKKDPATGKFPSRLEWLYSNDPHMPIRWVIDYRLVNAASDVAKIPLPHIEELFDRMEGAVVFTLLDLASGYHQMRMAPTSKQFTAFRTNHEIYHWNVAPMGLAGMPGTWTRLMRKILSHLPFVVVYLDDICIFSRSMDDHTEHLRCVCEVLREHKLYARPDKCEFGQTSVDFLGHTISDVGLHVDARKTRAIAEWPEPSTVKDLQRFLGLAGYYRRFIENFAKLVLPLSGLVRKTAEWTWLEPQRRAFYTIKLALQNAPVLRMPDFKKPFLVTTDASHDCIGGVLSQIHDGHDLPVAFFSKKLGVHELNWPVHEKELFAIKQALARWRHYLHGTHFDVITDNSACKWFLQHPRVSGRIARWLDFFASFDFKLHHRPGSQNVVADALSRPPSPSIKPGGEVKLSICALRFSCYTCTKARATFDRRAATHEKMMSISSRDQAVMLCAKQPASSARPTGAAQVKMQLHAASVVDATTVSSIQLDQATKKAFQKAYAKDPIYKSLWKTKRATSEYEVHQGLIYVKSTDNVRRLCVPNHQQLRVDVIHNVHDAAIMAHPGVRRTQLAAAQWYFWPTMDADIKGYVQSCESCMRYKSNTGRKAGKMQPIPLPSACWDVVSTDFITHLPVSDGFDAIMVVVDKLSKRPVYIPTHTTATAEDTATLFFNNVIRHYGIPSTIISDRDPKFTSKFWNALVRLMNIRTAMTTAHRAQADVQTERQNRTLEDSLRCSISYHGNDWNEHLPMIEYAHATLVSTSSKLPPFFVDTGRQPKNPLGTRQDTERVARTRVEYASRFVQHRQQVIERARKNLLEAQATQKKFYDKRRAENPFSVGDLALLSTQDLNISHATAETTLRSRKFIPRFIGPFPIEELRGNVALLKLPANLKHLSPRFNIDKLKPYTSNPSRFEGRSIPKSTLVIFDDDGEPLHVIEALIKKRIFNRQPEYLVKWHGLPHHENTWERERQIKHVSHWQALLKDLRSRNQATCA